MIIRTILFILNSEYSVSDGLLENTIIIKDDENIRVVYCDTECITAMKIECGEPF